MKKTVKALLSMGFGARGKGQILNNRAIVNFKKSKVTVGFRSKLVPSEEVSARKIGRNVRIKGKTTKNVYWTDEAELIHRLKKPAIKRKLMKWT